jgi:hypothetical protein
MRRVDIDVFVGTRLRKQACGCCIEMSGCERLVFNTARINLNAGIGAIGHSDVSGLALSR